MIVCPTCGTHVPLRLVVGPVGAKKLVCNHCHADIPV